MRLAPSTPLLACPGNPPPCPMLPYWASRKNFSGTLSHGRGWGHRLPRPLVGVYMQLESTNPLTIAPNANNVGLRLHIEKRPVKKRRRKKYDVAAYLVVLDYGSVGITKIGVPWVLVALAAALWFARDPLHGGERASNRGRPCRLVGGQCT